MSDMRVPPASGSDAALVLRIDNREPLHLSVLADALLQALSSDFRRGGFLGWLLGK